MGSYKLLFHGRYSVSVLKASNSRMLIYADHIKRYFVQFQPKFKYIDKFYFKYKLRNFTTNHPVEVAVFHAC